jgi:hypothetical protein
MNLKTTLFLGALVAVGGLVWLVLRSSPARDAAGPTVQFLEQDLKPENIKRIEITRGDRKVALEHAEEWSLPGKWPVRASEVNELVKNLTGLHTRFVPIPVGDKPKLKEYGLDPAELIVKVRLKDKEHTLRFGDEQSESNRFSRATFVRLDDQKEVVRLAPGLIAALDRPQEYYQLRRLFPPERVAKDNDPVEKIEQVSAKAIAIKSSEATIELTHGGDGWEIDAPVKDHVDPDKLKTLLTAFPEIWAERFVDKKDKKWEDFGLKDPQTVLTVTKPSGAKVKLLVGSESETKFRKVAKPPMPQQPFMPPKQDFDLVPEAYRFAKLEDNDQIFEIKADKLKDISVSLDSLRDAQLARFRADQVKRLEIQIGEPGAAAGEHLVFVKEKERWRMEKPRAEDAESGPVSELLDKLAGLQARDKDILDKVELKTVGLEKPAATIKITVEEEKGDKENKTKSTRAIVFDLGTKETKETKEKAREKDKDKDKDKLYVKVEGWPRVSAVDDALLKLVRRPEYVYRNRKVLDVAAADLGKLEIQRGPESYVFQQDKGTWKLTEPVAADVDSGKVSRLAGELGKLEVVEFVTDNPKAEDLDKVYGLAKPALTAKLLFADAKKPAHTLTLGKAKGDKEYFARLENGPVFVVKKDLHDDLDRDALVYRPLEVMHPAKDKIHELAVHKDGQEYRLLYDGKTWKVRGPFDAAALTEAAEPMVDELANLRAVRYVAHAAKDLKDYGLDKPYLTVRLVPTAKDEPDQEILIGKKVDKEAVPSAKADKEADKESGRFAKLSNSSAVFVLADKAVAAFDHGALDFLDKKLLTLDAKSIQKVRSAGPVPFTLQQKKDAWEVLDSPAPPFVAEEEAVQNVLRPWSNLRAERIEAYGPKIDWAAYSLDKPAHTVTVTLVAEKEKDDEKDRDKDKDKVKVKEKEKTMEHQLALGKATDKGLRFARLDKQDEVVVLDASAVAGLTSSYLDFVDHQVLKFDLDTVTAIQRQMPGGELDLVKRDDSWRFAKPADKAADDPTIGELLEKAFRLRAERIAAYPAKDLASYGLDNPAAVVTLKLTDAQGRAVEHVIKVGKPAADKKEQRYALIDKGDAVVVLGPDLSRQLVAPFLYFADRNLPGFIAADKAVVEHPGRKVTFTHCETTWSMTDPVKAEAETTELDELVKSVRRLRADEIVADKDANLSSYGLDRPETQWYFSSGDKEVMHLLAGSADKEGRRYVKLGAGDQVFTLNAKLSARLADEYRSRKPWASLDAAQVEKLSYSGPASFSLKKKDSDWTLSPGADAKVNAKQVTDTLDALAGLKAARYVVDAKADLKLYGLEPTVWTIDVDIPSGKRTLHIGRAEGDSKRVYATVPGSDAVFIIGEAEAQRILRPMAEFLAPNAK